MNCYVKIIPFSKSLDCCRSNLLQPIKKLKQRNILAVSTVSFFFFSKILEKSPTTDCILCVRAQLTLIIELRENVNDLLRIYIHR